MKMPAPDKETIARRDAIARDLLAMLGSEGVVADEDSMSPFESDALTAYRQTPLVVALPADTGEVAAVLRYCQENNLKIVPRGAGTSLSGGALPLADGVLLSLTRMNRILDIDYGNCAVVAQPGVTNLAITKAVEERGFYYAPDPSSQLACSIGGNVAENSGGVHCLKYGLTTNNLLGLEVVTMDGEVLRLGGRRLDNNGYDLIGIMTGSEGLLGVVTEVTVRILQKPAVRKALLVGYDNVENAGGSVGAIIAKGIIPAGMEMMDNAAINATEDFVEAGYPRDAEALLIIELDGPEAEVEALAARVAEIVKRNGAGTIRISENEEERELFWAGRKAAFPAIGRLSPDYLCMDGTIPRRQLPEIIKRMQKMSRQFNLRVVNVFHAGDGNLHPMILFDSNIKGELERAEEFGAAILRACVELGGVLSGEHGIGVEKRDLMGEMFSEEDLKQQQRLKCAFDPDHLLNPGKVFPVLHRCAELGRLHVHKGKLPHPDIPRL